jgi:hypothetical protein
MMMIPSQTSNSVFGIEQTKKKPLFPVAIRYR